MRAGRSVPAHTIPESVDMSPDCTPCVTRGRRTDRISAGALTLVDRLVAVAEATVVRNLRRVIVLPAHRRPGMKLASAESGRKVDVFFDSQKKVKRRVYDSGQGPIALIFLIFDAVSNELRPFQKSQLLRSRLAVTIIVFFSKNPARLCDLARRFRF